MDRERNAKENEAFTLLKGVVDPELMVNIIDLGLVYDVRIIDEEKKIMVDLTLTSLGCPLGDVIIEDIKQLLAKNNPETIVEVNLVWQPRWTLENLTEEGKKALGRY